MTTQPATPAPARRSGMGTPPPDRGPRQYALDRAVCAAVEALMAIFRALPPSAARGLGRFLGRAAWRALPRKRAEMLRHMELAFRDEFSAEHKADWVRRNFEHLGLFVAEFSRLPLLRAENVDELCDLGELSILREVLGRQHGKGLLAVPAHHGNWELCGYAVALKGFALKSVARPLDNPQLNAVVDALRAQSGNEIIHKWQVLWRLKKMLDRGGIVTMSVDQNGGTGGIFVPLFCTLASTVASPAELHLASKAPICVCSLNRQPDGVHHKLHIWDTIEFQPFENYEQARYEVLSRINRAYEKAIRAYPEQWLWGHRRWKTRPPGEKLGADGLPPRANEVSIR